MNHRLMMTYDILQEIFLTHQCQWDTRLTRLTSHRHQIIYLVVYSRYRFYYFIFNATRVWLLFRLESGPANKNSSRIQYILSEVNRITISILPCQPVIKFKKLENIVKLWIFRLAPDIQVICTWYELNMQFKSIWAVFDMKLSLTSCVVDVGWKFFFSR